MTRIVSWESPHDRRTYQAPLTQRDEVLLTYAFGSNRCPAVLDEYCRLAGMTDWWTVHDPSREPKLKMVN